MKQKQEQKQKGIIALEDGTVIHGKSFGFAGETFGELVFNTSMTGYQEIVTDPSYDSQVIMFTYPLIGNYGVNKEDTESSKIHSRAVIVRDYIDHYSNFRATESFGSYLKKNKIVALENIDTRALTRHIRIKGAMKCVVSVIDDNEKRLIKKAKEYKGLIGQDLVKNVTCKQNYSFSPKKNKNKRIVLMDFGVKNSILKSLDNLGFEVIVVKANTSAKEILNLKPKGIMLSNGPGDPSALPYVIEEVKKLIGKLPVFGICLGHQILNLAFGAKTYKLKFGHRGGNHPVKDLRSGKIYITSQNHGFAVDVNSIDKKDVEITQMNLYDNTLEGIRHKKNKAFSVQYHPEASPGPNDTSYLFNEFKEMVLNER